MDLTAADRWEEDWCGLRAAHLLMLALTAHCEVSARSGSVLSKCQCHVLS